MSWKLGIYLKQYGITCFKLSQHPRSAFPWYLDVCKLSVYMIHLKMFLTMDYFNWFQRSGETSCLFTTSIWQTQKPACCLTVLDFPEDISHRSVLALEVQDFSCRLLPPCIVSTLSEVGGVGSKRISAIVWKGEERGGGWMGRLE